MGLRDRHISGTGHSYSLWPVLLVLLAAVLVPTGCVLWFMNLAMRNESLAVRQRLTDVYRENLQTAQKDMDRFWQSTMLELDTARPDASPAQVFASLVRQGPADSVVLLDERGTRAYPADAAAEGEAHWSNLPAWDNAVQLEAQDGKQAEAAAAFASLAADAQSADLKAQALQAQVRCLLRLGKKQEALKVLTGPLAQDGLRGARDSSGRLIVPAMQLLALQLLGWSADPAFTTILNALKQQLDDYSIPMPAAQRRFLMHAMKELGPSPANLEWATLPAEDMAAEYLAVEQPPPQTARLGKTKAPGIWQIVTANRNPLFRGRRIALFHEQRIVELARHTLAQHMSPGISLTLHPPTMTPEPEAQPFLSTWATTYLPGWTLEARLVGADPFAAAASRQRAAYLWTGGVGIVLIAVLAASITGYVSRQMRLTRMKNDLIATVSHELKTPLASMRMLVDTLLEGRYRDQRQVSDYLQLIARENQRLSRLIDNFLTFSRMERNKRAFVFAPLRMEDVAATAVEAVRERFSGPDCRLDVDIAPNLPAVHGDRDALVTVVVNLLDNAWKYTAQDKHVILRGYTGGRDVVLEVQDNGIGIPARALRKIFGRFYQVDRSLSRKAGGCGLGLSIVQFIVASHGGSVDVRSEVGKGSTFLVRLPCQMEAADEGRPTRMKVTATDDSRRTTRPA